MEGASTKTTTSSKNPAAPGGRGLVDPGGPSAFSWSGLMVSGRPLARSRWNPRPHPRSRIHRQHQDWYVHVFYYFLAVPVGPPQLSVTSNLFWREAFSTNHTCMYQYLCSLPSMPSLRQSRGWWEQAK